MPGIARRRLQRGFTLLEVLMVVLLVGIISSVVMLSINSGGEQRQLREESDRLATLLEQASSEAVMQNQEFGLRLTDHGYVFLCLDEAKQRWAACKDEVFRERELADGLEIRMLRQSQLKGLPSSGKADDQKDAGEDDGKRLTPDLFLLSSGEASAGSIELRVAATPEVKSEISVDEIGRVRLTGEGEPEPAAEEADHAR